MSQAPSLFRVTVEITGLDTAIAFYERLLSIEGRRVRGGRCYFDCGPVILALLDVSSERKEARAAPQDLYFAVSPLEPVHARAHALGCLSKEKVHGESGGEIVTRPWGERSFYAEDPFGNGLCFVERTTVFTGA